MGTRWQWQRMVKFTLGGQAIRENWGMPISGLMLTVQINPTRRLSNTLIPKSCKLEVEASIQHLSGENGAIYSFGCGSDGRLGHAESDKHVYLYR